MTRAEFKKYFDSSALKGTISFTNADYKSKAAYDSVLAAGKKDNWFKMWTINPVSHVGTKELPPHNLSRFPIRIMLDYPPEDTELEIIKKHVKVNTQNEEDNIKSAIKLAHNPNIRFALDSMNIKLYFTTTAF